MLAAGAINSPKILLSGLGPAAHLKGMGISVVADRPGVGQNLQDHLELYIQQECLPADHALLKAQLVVKAMIGAQWLFTKTGDGATNHFESAAFLRSKAGVPYPISNIISCPLPSATMAKTPAKAHGFQAHVGPMRSASRGK